MVGKWRVQGQKWWDDDDKVWRWGYIVICPTCGPLPDNFSDSPRLLPWDKAMLVARDSADRYGLTVPRRRKWQDVSARGWPLTVNQSTFGQGVVLRHGVYSFHVPYFALRSVAGALLSFVEDD